MSQDRIDPLLQTALQGSGGITVLTGAGISAESNIPTFRGPEGYWTVGSQVYQPQEMATYQMFRQQPQAVWQWYLYRLGVCQAAQPNAGHKALVALAQRLPNRFALITQNVDNLHLQAGQRPEHTFQIHGNIFYVRCAAQCRPDVQPLPDGVGGKAKDEALTEAEWRRLHCPHCGGLLRPHVLWFDETYNEHYYHFHSALAVARTTALLLVVGTSGATNLPNQVVAEILHHGGAIIDINIAANPFGRLAASHDHGLAIQQAGSTALPMIVQRIDELLEH